MNYGAIYDNLEDFKKISAILFSNFEAYSLIPALEIQKSLYSAVQMRGTTLLPHKTAAILDLNTAGDDIYEMLHYLSIPIIVLKIDTDNLIEAASKTMYLQNKYQEMKFVARIDDFDKWNTFFELCNCDPQFTVIPTMDPDIEKTMFWFSCRLSGFIIPPEILNEKLEIKDLYRPLFCAIRERSLPVFVYSKTPKFQYITQNICSFMAQFEPANHKYNLATPLQPLYCQLSSSIYEVFEADTTKYALYQKAIQAALAKKGADAVVAVAGAGRGPIVDCALKAGAKKIIVIEKNHAGSMYLRQRLAKDWPPSVSFFEGDMRTVELPEKVDILVSELLGGFGDNELSPECIAGAERLLAEGALSVPSQYTSFLLPVSSQLLHSSVAGDNRLNELIVTFLDATVFLGEPRRVLTFTHPGPNELYGARVLEFPINRGGVLHGFGGWFDCVLADGVRMSSDPINGTQDMSSWATVFLPLCRPIKVEVGQIVKLWFARKCSGEKVWYEWAVISPVLTPIQNAGGRNYSFGLNTHSLAI